MLQDNFELWALRAYCFRHVALNRLPNVLLHRSRAFCAYKIFFNRNFIPINFTRWQARLVNFGRKKFSSFENGSRLMRRVGVGRGRYWDQFDERRWARSLVTTGIFFSQKGAQCLVLGLQSYGGVRMLISSYGFTVYATLTDSDSW